ncbi:MAG: hydantoinase/oxoprolinase family protein, partial [Actinomycetota bacterium]
KSLRIPRVIVPVYPGALSALGILISDVVKDHSRTVLWRVRDLPVSRLTAIYSELQQEIEAELAKEDWKGRATWERSADLRYRGQGFELNLPYGRDLLARFHAEHKKRYGYSSPEREVEIVTVRLRGRIRSPEKLTKIKVEPAPENLQKNRVRVWFDGRQWDTPVIPRSMLAGLRRYRGPAIVTEYSATTVVPPGLSFQADKAGNLLIEVV